jgi:amidase
MTGTTGLKPTWGRVSRYGVFPMIECLDTVGPITRTAGDAAAMLAAIAGADPNDPTAAPVRVPNYLATIDDGIAGIRIGIDRHGIAECSDPQIANTIDEAVETLAGLGADIRSINLPSFDLMPMYPMFNAAMADAHRATFPQQADDYGPALKAILEQALAISGRDVAAALNHANALRGMLASLFTKIDLLLTPVLPQPTTKVGVLENDPVLALAQLRFTSPFNVSGQPAITLRCGTDANAMPMGFQLIGRHFEEELLFRAGHAYQSVTDWHVLHPDLP